MDIGELLHGIKSGKLSDLVLLRNITEINLKEMQDAGYQVVMTGTEYQKRFPWLPMDYAYASKSFMSGILYYDPAKYICVPLNIFGDAYIGVDGKQDGKLVLEAIARCEKDFEAKDFERLLMPCSVDAYKVELLSRMIREYPGLESFKLFRSHYTSLDYGFEHLKADDIIDLYQKAPLSHFKKLRDKFKNQSTLVIYRGEGEKSTDTNRAFSWTLSQDIAYFFATRFASEFAQVIRAEVSIDNVLDYFDERSEDEVLIKPGTAKITHCNWMPGMDTIRSQGVPRTYFDEAKLLYDVNAEDIHGYSHVCRMLFLLKLATDKMQLSKREHRILWEAIHYHDLGRAGDGIEEGHGVKSARLYMASHRGVRDADIISAIIENHCVDDDVAFAKMDALREPELATRMLSLLKDIDGLDRFRLGSKELDVNYIRNEEMLEFILVAKLLQQFKF